MAEPIKCFFLKPTQSYRKGLRRYRPSWKDDKPVEEHPCPLWPGKHSYHNRENIIEPKLDLPQQPCSGDDETDVPHSDPRWPLECACGTYRFWDCDEWQINYAPLYERSDGGDLVTLADAPPGAMWDAFWMPDRYKGDDSLCLVVKLPNSHQWMLDSQASNCTRPGEPHRCWVRHGVPPDIHVDKNGNTCAAGAGSILVGQGGTEWHGFLQHGYLVQC